MANNQEGKKSTRKKKSVVENQVIEFFNKEENIPYNYKQVSAGNRSRNAKRTGNRG